MAGWWGPQSQAGGEGGGGGDPWPVCVRASAVPVRPFPVVSWPPPGRDILTLFLVQSVLHTLSTGEKNRIRKFIEFILISSIKTSWGLEPLSSCWSSWDWISDCGSGPCQMFLLWRSVVSDQPPTCPDPAQIVLMWSTVPSNSLRWHKHSKSEIRCQNRNTDLHIYLVIRVSILVFILQKLSC